MYELKKYHVSDKKEVLLETCKTLKEAKQLMRMYINEYPTNYKIVPDGTRRVDVFMNTGRELHYRASLYIEIDISDQN